jgi:[ribosomal protein S5]-alanine N-acetyltransferase
MSETIILTTPRLILRTPCKSDLVKFQDFENKNQEHFARWRATSSEPITVALFYKWTQEAVEGRSVRFMLFNIEDPEAKIIGSCNFTQIFRGSFQACYLGYQIDQDHEGKGLMLEAAERAIQHMFEEQNIHRIMANYMPSNAKSARLLAKLGFVVEGRAKDYLRINGSWEDHVLTSLTNQNWLPPL